MSAQSNPEETRYWCHLCSAQIRPVLPAFTCPTCGGEFIEEMEEGQPAEDQPTSFTPFHATQPQAQQGSFRGSMATSPPPFPDLGQLFQQVHVFLQQQQQNLNSQQQQSGRTQSATDSQQQPQASSTTSTQSPFVPPVTPFPTFAFTYNSQNVQPLFFAHQLNQPAHVTTTNPFGPGGLASLFEMFAGGATPFLSNLSEYALGDSNFQNILNQMFENAADRGPPPAAKEAVEALPVVRILQSNIDKKEDCAICQDEYQLDEEVLQLECGHRFHPPCIKQWLSVVCMQRLLAFSFCYLC
ncbi:E3 ubiquitin-protein ligase SIRP1 [Balamuthia mandrillaris]